MCYNILQIVSNNQQSPSVCTMKCTTLQKQLTPLRSIKTKNIHAKPCNHESMLSKKQPTDVYIDKSMKDHDMPKRFKRLSFLLPKLNRIKNSVYTFLFFMAELCYTTGLNKKLIFEQFPPVATYIKSENPTSDAFTSFIIAIHNALFTVQTLNSAGCFSDSFEYAFIRLPKNIF